MKMLTKRQINALKRHSRHHTARHMNEMTRLMTRSRNPLNFTQAHTVTMKKVGR
tara:strand:+ start:42 stop:203 length:162 start_codon:yes stop_codon:yes gene_type:complete